MNRLTRLTLTLSLILFIPRPCAIAAPLEGRFASYRTLAESKDSIRLLGEIKRWTDQARIELKKTDATFPTKAATIESAFRDSPRALDVIRHRCPPGWLQHQYDPLDEFSIAGLLQAASPTDQKQIATDLRDIEGQLAARDYDESIIATVSLAVITSEATSKAGPKELVSRLVVIDLRDSIESQKDIPGASVWYSAAKTGPFDRQFEARARTPVCYEEVKGAIIWVEVRNGALRSKPQQLNLNTGYVLKKWYWDTLEK